MSESLKDIWSFYLNREDAAKLVKYLNEQFSF